MFAIIPDITTHATSSFSYPTPTQLSFTPTKTDLLVFTTPFIPPPDCHTIWQPTTRLESTYSYRNDSVSTSTWPVEVLYSNPAHPDYSSCQPSGWNQLVPTARHSYSPGVCPTGWPAHNMAQDLVPIADQSTWRTVSTAYCCMP